jgi:hypothetical protein
MGQTLEKCTHSQGEIHKQLGRLQQRPTRAPAASDVDHTSSTVGDGTSQTPSSSASSCVASDQRGVPTDLSMSRASGARVQNTTRSSERHQHGLSTTQMKSEQMSRPLRSVGFVVGSPEPPPPPPLVPRPGVDVYDLIDDDDLDNTCPTCLESYTVENPRIQAFCGHAFHLSCIYDWLERSPYCAVCARPMMFSERDSPGLDIPERPRRASSDSSWWTQDDTGSAASSASTSERLDIGINHDSAEAPVIQGTVIKSLSERVTELTMDDRLQEGTDFAQSGKEICPVSPDQCPESSASEAIQTIEMRDLIQWDDEATEITPCTTRSGTVTGTGSPAHPSSGAYASERPVEAEVR